MTLPTFSLTTWAGLAASAAFLGTFWRQATDIISRVGDLFVGRIVVKEEAARAVMVYVLQHGRRSPFGLVVYGGVPSFVSPKKRVEVVAYEGLTSDRLLFWVGRVPILVGQGSAGGERSPNIGSQASDAYPVYISYLRGTINIDALIEVAVTAFNQKRQHLGEYSVVKRFQVVRLHGGGHSLFATGSDKADNKSPAYVGSTPAETIQQLQRGELRLLTWKPEELTERASDRPPFDLYPFGENPLSILPEIETWLAHESWFRSKGVPWRRGYLAHGEPGSGKSTFIRSVAIKHDLPLYVFDLASMDNQSFATNWKTAQQNGPAIVLLEDLDTIYKGRDFIATVSKDRDTVTFDCLLNTISGVGSSDGILLFITTNHVDSLDSALGVPTEAGRSSRPGRIDRAIYFGPMEEAQRLKLAQFVLSDFPEEVARIVTEGEGETAAQFQERCAQFAEKAFWVKGVTSEIAPVSAEERARRHEVAEKAAAEEYVRTRMFPLA